MAYLTDYSYRQLIERVEIKDLDKIDRQFFKTNIYDNEYLFYFFNQLDLKKLFAEKMVLSGDKKFVLTYKKVPPRTDDLGYVLEIGGNVKYHKDDKCEALYRGFKNFYMPESVVRLEENNSKKHLEVVKDIREYFKSNNYTVERYEAGEITDDDLTSYFNDTFPERYDIEPISKSASDKNQFKWYIARKSKGNVGTEESFDYNHFLLNIIELLKTREQLCNGKTLQSLSKYDFLESRDNTEISNYIIQSIDNGYLKNVSEVFIENYGIDKLKIFWREHLKLKREAFNLLSDHFKWTYNYKGKVFDEVFLEDFGLEPCNYCYNRRISIRDIL